MGREVKTEKRAVKGKEKVVATTEEYKLEKVDIEGTRCDFCGQWFADDENVEFTELYENPHVKGLPDREMYLEELLEYLYAAEVMGRDIGTDLDGNEFVAGVRTTELPTKRAVWVSMQQIIEQGGGPSKMKRHVFEATQDREYDPRKLEDGEIIFKLDMEPEIAGRKEFMCEYCKENHE